MKGLALIYQTSNKKECYPVMFDYFKCNELNDWCSKHCEVLHFSEIRVQVIQLTVFYGLRRGTLSKVLVFLDDD